MIGKLKSEKMRRNDPCPCGSGKKLKNCCLKKVQRVRAGILAGKSREKIQNEELFIHGRTK
jgi:hypothetical protein